MTLICIISEYVLPFHLYDMRNTRAPLHCFCAVFFLFEHDIQYFMVGIAHPGVADSADIANTVFGSYGTDAICGS